MSCDCSIELAFFDSDHDYLSGVHCSGLTGMDDNYSKRDRTHACRKALSLGGR